MRQNRPNRRAWRRCPHIRLRGIYGDEINHSAGYRLECVVCGRLLDGPVYYATEPHDVKVRADAAGISRPARGGYVPGPGARLVENRSGRIEPILDGEAWDMLIGRQTDA